MTTAAQDNFETEARMKMAKLGIKQAALGREFECHRNSIFQAMRNPALVPDIHRRLARRLKLRPVL
jgi:hypothetical protein